MLTWNKSNFHLAYVLLQVVAQWKSSLTSTSLLQWHRFLQKSRKMVFINMGLHFALTVCYVFCLCSDGLLLSSSLCSVLVLCQSSSGPTLRMACVWPSRACFSSRVYVSRRHAADDPNPNLSWKSSIRIVWPCCKRPLTPSLSSSEMETWTTVEVKNVFALKGDVYTPLVKSQRNYSCLYI